jgi:hypothetical protein
MRRGLLFYFFLIVSTVIVRGQELYFNTGDSVILLSQLNSEIEQNSQDEITASIYQNIQKLGYWDCRLDSIQKSAEVWLVFGELGEKYSFDRLSIDDAILDFTGKRKGYFEEQLPGTIENDVLSFYLNAGYPFARVYFDSVRIKDSRAHGILKVQKGGIQFVDSLIVKTEGKFSEKVLKQMLSYKAGELYNERKIKSIPQIIGQYTFLSIPTEPRILFTREKNVLYVYLQEEKAHYFDGLIGFNTDEAGDVNFRGKLELKLENAFHRGENVYLKWDAQGENSQTLDIKTALPFVYKSWGVKADLKIHKQDSSFVKTDYAIGLQYQLKSNWRLGIGVEKSESSVTKKEPLSTDRLFAFEKTLYYGQVQYRKLDKIFQTRRGLQMDVSLKAGNRTETDLDESEYFVDARIQKYFPLKDKFSIKTDLRYRAQINDVYRDNNLLFLGGSQNLRGFLENQFTLTSFAMLSPSFRYHFEQNYMLELYTDQSILYHKGDSELDGKHAWSMGVQMEMPVKSGWLYLGYGVGTIEGESLNFSEGLIHFGLRNSF